MLEGSLDGTIQQALLAHTTGVCFPLYSPQAHRRTFGAAFARVLRLQTFAYRWIARQRRVFWVPGQHGPLISGISSHWSSNDE